MESKPHGTNDKVKAWEDRADELMTQIAQEPSLPPSDDLEKAYWEGLKYSVTEKYRSEAEAEELYFNWINKRHGD